MKDEGFSIIPITHEHQLAYACNVLNLGNGRIISVHPPSARQIVKHPAFKGDVQVRGGGRAGIARVEWARSGSVVVSLCM